MDKDYLEEFADTQPFAAQGKKQGKLVSVGKKTTQPVKVKTRHKKPIYDPHYKKVEECLKEINALKQKMVTFYNQGNILKADRQLGFLIKTQKDEPELLAKSLCDACQQIMSCEQQQKLLELACDYSPHDAIALNSYGKALAENGNYNQACEMFERSLLIDANNTIALTSYGKALAENGNYNQACEIFERALAIDANNTIALTSYAKALAENGNYNKACEIFERSLRIDANNTIALTSYGKALAENGNYAKACEIFERALFIDANDTIALTSYGKALAENGNYNKACEIFERALAIDSYDNISLYLYGRLLFNWRDYTKAFQYLTQIQRSEMYAHPHVVICFLLGQLAYLNNEKQQAENYFTEAIEFSEKSHQTRLKSAQHILANDPRSEKALEILHEIETDHSSYDKAEKILAFHLPFPALYKKFQGETRYDLQMLNRGIYHKIQNEIFILKSMAQRAALKNTMNPIHLEVITRLEDIIAAIANNREQEQHSLDIIASSDLKNIEEVISETVHRIVDYVNNELAIIKSKTRRMLQKEIENTPLAANLAQLLKQIEYSETALNELKAINEGIKLTFKRFKIADFFKEWREQPILETAQLSFEITNADALFLGDSQKLRSCINEIIANSVKHNSTMPLLLTISSKNVFQLPFYLKTPAKKGQCFWEIGIADNGKGIPSDKKEWIFFPLNSTYPESSGLGLFVVKKTIDKMNGYIIENGQQGANFLIYLPYQENQNE